MISREQVNMTYSPLNILQDPLTKGFICPGCGEPENLAVSFRY